MATTWIVAADESRARVLQVLDRELQSDAEPKFSGRPGSGPGSDSERRGAVEHSARAFARELGRYLDKARIDHLVADELPKDLSWFTAREIERDFAQGRGRAP